VTPLTEILGGSPAFSSQLKRGRRFFHNYERLLEGACWVCCCFGAAVLNHEESKSTKRKRGESMRRWAGDFLATDNAECTDA